MISFDTVESMRAYIGQEFATSPWLAIEQPQVDAFAQLTGDDQWIHTDPVRAQRESGYGGTIVHGFFLLALLPQLTIASFEVVNFSGIAVNCGFDMLRFLRPVPVGSKVQSRYTMEAINEVKGGSEIVLGVGIYREGLPRPACQFSWRIRYLAQVPQPASQVGEPT